MWHAALVKKLHAVRVDDPMLELLQNYLQETHLKVVQGGQQL